MISDDKKYGPIGVVFALLSWQITIGINSFTHLGAATHVISECLHLIRTRITHSKLTER